MIMPLRGLGPHYEVGDHPTPADDDRPYPPTLRVGMMEGTI